MSEAKVEKVSAPCSCGGTLVIVDMIQEIKEEGDDFIQKLKFSWKCEKCGKEVGEVNG